VWAVVLQNELLFRRLRTGLLLVVLSNAVLLLNELLRTELLWAELLRPKLLHLL
jgi:hypothetical protein